jgi:hypothetical protein
VFSREAQKVEALHFAIEAFRGSRARELAVRPNPTISSPESRRAAAPRKRMTLESGTGRSRARKSSSRAGGARPGRCRRTGKPTDTGKRNPRTWFGWFGGSWAACCEGCASSFCEAVRCVEREPGRIDASKSNSTRPAHVARCGYGCFPVSRSTCSQRQGSFHHDPTGVSRERRRCRDHPLVPARLNLCDDCARRA